MLWKKYLRGFLFWIGGCIAAMVTCIRTWLLARKWDVPFGDVRDVLGVVGPSVPKGFSELTGEEFDALLVFWRWARRREKVLVRARELGLAV